MGRKLFKKNGYIYDEFGTPLKQYQSTSGDKSYAVIATCGHCGDGYYIPIMFPRFCQNAEVAVDSVRAIPRVKRDKRDFVLDVFEITDIESMFINCINDRDPYLKGFFNKDDRELQDRRIVRKDVLEELLKDNPKANVRELFSNYGIKTAEEYYGNQVLQRFFAPRLQGDKVVFAHKVNREELKQEYFKQNCIRFGLKKNNVAIISLYYQIYGEENPLGIKYKNGKFVYKDRWNKVFYYDIEEKYLSKMMEAGIVDEKGPIIPEPVIEEIVAETKPVQMVSAVEKFNRRFQKYVDKKKEKEVPPGGETQPNNQ